MNPCITSALGRVASLFARTRTRQSAVEYLIVVRAEAKRARRCIRNLDAVEAGGMRGARA